MLDNDGFTLIELMIVVTIVAILASLGLPTYRHYTQRAAITDLLQAVIPYKIAVELCALEFSNQGDKTLSGECQQGKQGIPEPYHVNPKAPGYTKSIGVAPKGVITVIGHKSLAGLTVTLTPSLDVTETVTWSKKCQSDSNTLVSLCISAFKLADDVQH